MNLLALQRFMGYEPASMQLFGLAPEPFANDSDIMGAMNDAPKSHRRWLRFSLRTLLVVFTLICIWLGVETSRVLRQKRAAATVQSLGGTVFLGYRFDSSGKPRESQSGQYPLGF